MSSASINAGNPRQVERFPWRVFWLLLVASITGVVAVLPFIFDVFRPLIQGATPPPLSLPVIILVAVVQNLLLLSLAIGSGLLLARRLGLGAPLLEAWLYRKEPNAKALRSVGFSALIGIAVGIVVLVPLLLAAPHLPDLPLVSAARVALWKRALVGLYGGIDEEVLSRLFLLTLVGWLGLKILRKGESRLTAGIFWIANVLVAILFGLGHLPSASLVMRITPAVVVLALVLNGVPAITFGYLYWKRGLESAMIAHFCADVVLWVIGPTFL